MHCMSDSRVEYPEDYRIHSGDILADNADSEKYLQVLLK